MFEVLKDILVYLGSGVLIVFPIIWLIGFVVKSEKFEEMKERLRLVLAVIVGIWLYTGIGMGLSKPSKSRVIAMMQKWYPNTMNYEVTITESKIETDTYKAYVSFNFNDSTSTCNAEVTIRPAGKEGYLKYNTKGYTCN